MSAVATMGVLKTKELGFASTLKSFGTASDSNPCSLTFANQAAARTLSVPALSGNAELLTDLSSIAVTQVNLNGASAEASLADTDEFLFYDASASSNKKVTGANLKTYVGAGGSGVPSGTNGQVIVYDASNAAAAVALSGDASMVASGALTIANNAVTEQKLANDAVTEQKLASSAVTNAKVSASANIAYAKLNLTNAIQHGDLTTNSVKSAKIQDGAVTTAKFAVGAVDSAALAANAVTASAIANDAVESAKLQNNAVSSAKIADDAVTDAKIASFPSSAGTLDASKIVVCDSNKDLTGGRNVTLTGTSQAAEMAVGSSKWKFVISGNNMLLQYWGGAAWITKQTFEPS